MADGNAARPGHLGHQAAHGTLESCVEEDLALGEGRGTHGPEQTVSEPRVVEGEGQVSSQLPMSRGLGRVVRADLGAGLFRGRNGTLLATHGNDQERDRCGHGERDGTAWIGSSLSCEQALHDSTSVTDMLGFKRIDAVEHPPC